MEENLRGGGFRPPPGMDRIKATFHLTISMRAEHATGKIQRNNYHHGSCGPSLTGKTMSVFLIFTQGMHWNVKNRWVRSSLYRYDNRDLKQIEAATVIKQISIQKDSRPSEFTRPLTLITLNWIEIWMWTPPLGRRVSLLNPIRPGLFSRSPGPRGGGGLRGPDAKNRG